MSQKSGRITTSSGGKSTNDIYDKPTFSLTIPVREIADREGILLGFRQQMLDVGGKGRVLTGAGLGTDFIILEWDDKQVVIRGSELLKAWVATFAPEDAARFPV